MSTLSVNPGRWLQLLASLELVDGEVLDRETGEPVTLVRLLSEFRASPIDTVIGTVTVTIEPAHARGWWEQ
jgi:hypothetical protein